MWPATAILEESPMSMVWLAGVAGLVGVWFYIVSHQQPPLQSSTPVTDTFERTLTDINDDDADITPRNDPMPTSQIPGLEPSSETLGNVADITAAGSYFDFLVALHRRFGSIAKFWYMDKLMVSLAAPDLFRRTARACNRPAELFEVFSPLMAKESLGFANGLEGKRRRAAYDPVLSHTAMQGYIPGIQRAADEWLEEWRALEVGQHIKVKDYTLRYAMKIILQQLFGDFFSGIEDIVSLQHNFDHCWHELEGRTRGDIPAPDSERNREFLRRRDEIYAKIELAVLHRRQHPPPPGEEKLIDEVLRFCGDDLTLIKAELVNFIIGGYMSSGDILTWVIYFLSTHLDVQDKLYAELKELLMNDPISFQSLPHLKYFRQVLDESLRASLLGTFVARTADADMVLGGYLVPKGTTLVQAMGVVHLDEKYYPEPRKFDPERFSEENVKSRPTHAFVPFGFAGGRKCPGFRLAYLECMVFMSTLLHKYCIAFSPGQQEPEIVHGVISFLKGDIFVTLEERE